MKDNVSESERTPLANHFHWQAELGSIQQVRISGGGAKSALWRQIMADVLGVELVTVNTTEGAAYGAALRAGVGAGHYENVPAACEGTIQITGRTSPTQATRAYQDYYPHYRALYPALAPVVETSRPRNSFMNQVPSARNE